MAKRVARFEKVTYRQFEKDWIDAFNVPELNMSTVHPSFVSPFQFKTLRYIYYITSLCATSIANSR